MISTSDFEYRRLCEELIHRIIARPGMYVRDFGEIETLFYGHQEAFEQLSVIQHNDGFNLAFSLWLTEKKDAPTGAGWANAIKKLAQAEGKDPFEALSENVVSFFDEWV